MHQKVNDVLTLIVVILSGYLILYPLWPEATYRFRSITTNSTVPSVMPETNTLFIPKIGVNGEIYEGDENALAKGIWHRPQSSISATSGNLVLAAHRFQYTRNTQTFYHLDKLTKGDEITLFWDGKVHKYAVQVIKEVNPHNTTVEAPTEKPMLTLYTCTPLWIGNKRLVITAEPI